MILNISFLFVCFVIDFQLYFQNIYSYMVSKCSCNELFKIFHEIFIEIFQEILRFFIFSILRGPKIFNFICIILDLFSALPNPVRDP